MKYLNKFIALGLGFALLFTGTNFAFGMFTSRTVQNNVITLNKPNITVGINKRVYFYGKSTESEKYNKLYIPVIIEGINSDTRLCITADVEIIEKSTQIDIANIKVEKGVSPIDKDIDCIVMNPLGNSDFDVKEKYNITVKVKIEGQNDFIFNETYGVEKYNQSNDFWGSTGERGQYIELVAPYKKSIEMENDIIENIEKPTSVEETEDKSIDESIDKDAIGTRSDNKEIVESENENIQE